MQFLSGTTQAKFCLPLLCAALISLGMGCGKKAPEASSQPAAAATQAGPVSESNLPGANEVLAAIDRNDYDAAIGGVIGVRQTVTTADQNLQFATLVHEVRLKLLEAAATDPKANQALTALRQITGGR